MGNFNENRLYAEIESLKQHNAELEEKLKIQSENFGNDILAKRINDLTNERNELLATIEKVKQSARDSSDMAGNYHAQVTRMAVQIEQLKADIAKLDPDYDFSKLNSVASDLDMLAFGDRLLMVSRQSQKPKEWNAIKEHTKAVVDNMVDLRCNLPMHLKSALHAYGVDFDASKLLEVFELSAAELLESGRL